MDSKCLISVVIPVFNYADTIERAICSVMTQKCSCSYELIVINDGSTDRTDEVVRKLYQKMKGRFQYFIQENAGAGAARNYGITRTCGSYLLFLDADDELIEGTLEYVFSFLKRNTDVQVLIGSHISVWPDGTEKKRSRKQYPNSAYKALYQYLIDLTLPIVNGATVMSREIFVRYRYPEKFKSCEDIPVFAYALANFFCITSDKPLVKIHKHSDSLRYNYCYDVAVGMLIVDEIFHRDRMPRELFSLREAFIIQRYLSLFKTSRRSKHYKKALSYYCEAYKRDTTVIFRIAYLRKLVCVCWHAMIIHFKAIF